MTHGYLHERIQPTLGIINIARDVLLSNFFLENKNIDQQVIKTFFGNQYLSHNYYIVIEEKSCSIQWIRSAVENCLSL